MNKISPVSYALAKNMIWHCSPTLVGVKPASLMVCENLNREEAKAEIETLNSSLNGHGLYFKPFCSCGKKNLLLVYRKHLLENHLEQPRVKEFLVRRGFPYAAGLNTLLEHFASLVSKSCEFPHEIGLLLGYPLDDVMGFIENKGQNYRLCGHWKVYGDEQFAMALFEKYNRCRDLLWQKFSSGLCIVDMLGASSVPAV